MQDAILERETGTEIHRATLDGWVMRVGELLVPVAAAMRIELLGGSYIQVDETPADVPRHDGRGKNHQAYSWQYGHPGGNVVFDFRMGRDGPREFLGNFEGLLQTDGYIADEKVGGPKLVQVAQAQALPASTLGKAASYTLVLWPRLTRFLEYAELERSNNLAGNSLREVALGRRNRIHVGSRETGPKVAAILSILETCRRKGIAVREYLGPVRLGLGGVSMPMVAASLRRGNRCVQCAEGPGLLSVLRTYNGKQQDRVGRIGRST